MNIIIICTDHKRNQIALEYFSKISFVKIIKIYVVKKKEPEIPKAPKKLRTKLKKLWKLHFYKRFEAENRRFKFTIKENFNQEKVEFINDLKKIFKDKNFFKKNKIDLCFTSGIPILKKEYLKILPKYILNLHLGLLPHYKGSITMFWPFLLLEPQMAGTTYHLLNKNVDNKNLKIDTGEIIHQNKPKLRFGYSMHDVAAEAILAAMRDLKKVFLHLRQRIKKNTPVKIDKSLETRGKLFKKSDWKPHMLEIIYKTFNDKIVDMYLRKEIFGKEIKIKKL